MYADRSDFEMCQTNTDSQKLIKPDIVDEYNKENILFPCKLSKNHIICNSCFEKWKNNCFKESKEVTCPICRNVLTKNGTYILYYQDGIKKQEVEYINDILKHLSLMNEQEGIVDAELLLLAKYFELVKKTSLVGQLDLEKSILIDRVNEFEKQKKETEKIELSMLEKFEKILSEYNRGKK